MSIPTGWCAKAIPDHILIPLEKIYRDELKKTIPEASNDLAYSTAYTHACAYHVLHQMTNLEGILGSDVIWGGPMPKYPLWDRATNSSRSRFLSRLQAFVDVATEHDRLHPGQPPILPNLRKMAEDMLIKVKERWPADTKPLDFYPAFKQDSLRLMQTQHAEQVPHVGAVHETTPSWRHSTQKSPPSPHDDEASKSSEKRFNLTPLKTNPKPQGSK